MLDNIEYKIKGGVCMTILEALKYTTENIKLWVESKFVKKGEVNTPILKNILIVESGWQGENSPYYQVVSCSGVSVNSKIDLQPTPEQLAELQDAEISLMATNNEGVVTIYAFYDRPKNDMNMQVLITEVSGLSSIIYGNIVGGSSGFGRTYLLEDEDGNQFTGVLVDELTLFTATAEDIKLGKIAATDSGITTGTHICE